MTPAAFGCLQGLVVLDLTQMLAGPYCTQMLADHGAEVIKIEPPQGDATRAFGPFLSEDELRAFGGYFQSVNRNKRSVMLDLKQESDRERLRSLVAHADILVENFRDGVMTKLGLGYDALAKLNPRLVYASIRGFGDSRHGASEYRDWPAYDVVAQAMSGLTGITGQPDMPVKVGPGVGDIVPAMMAAFGIVSAMLHVYRTGQGQFVDVSMTDSLLAVCERIVYQYSYTGKVPGPEGQHHPLFAPFGMFRAADGFVALGCPSDSFWKLFCDLAGEPDWKRDPRYQSNASRALHRDAVNALTEQFTRTHTKRELAALLGGKVPFGPVFDVQDIFSDAHFELRSMLPTVEQPGTDRSVAIAGVPMKFSLTPGGVKRRAPLLGEHNAEVFARFGVNAASVACSSSHSNSGSNPDTGSGAGSGPATHASGRTAASSAVTLNPTLDGAST
jgi:crotonobetainyl-CoA:carnitine CoA-transferase CaiB-like acyl-CoA transferase